MRIQLQNAVNIPKGKNKKRGAQTVIQNRKGYMVSARSAAKQTMETES